MMRYVTIIALMVVVLSISLNSVAQNAIRTGTTRDAMEYSFHHNESLTVHISGGTNEKYTAKQFAIMLRDMFADTNRTDNSTHAVVFYEETGKYDNASVIGYDGGYSFDRNGGKLERGDDVIHPYDAVLLIPRITEWHAKGGETGTSPSRAILSGQAGNR